MQLEVHGDMTMEPPGSVRDLNPVVQGMFWSYISGTWYPDDDNTTNPAPTHAGKDGDRFDDGLDVAPVVAVDPYAVAQTLTNGTRVDYPALTAVMNGVIIGQEVTPSVWRPMRQALSAAITLPSKSHPPHDNSFNKNQRPEQQIKDWANPMKGPLRTAMENYFLAKYRIYL
jgi:hypothetical protein